MSLDLPRPLSSQVWVEAIEQLPRQPDPNLYAWLTRPYILSACCKKTCHHFNIKILTQGCALPSLEEQNRLGILTQKPQWAFIRQVYLRDGSKPLCYGRIVIPHETYEQHWARINQAGVQPFGEAVLYSQPSFSRSAFEFTYIDEALDLDFIFQFQSEHTQQPIWGRRSLFGLKPFPILVVEIFFPDLPTYPDQFQDV